MKKLALILSVALMIELCVPMAGVEVYAAPDEVSETVLTNEDETIEEATSDAVVETVSEETVTTDEGVVDSIAEDDKAVSEETVSEETVSGEAVSEEAVSEDTAELDEEAAFTDCVIYPLTNYEYEERIPVSFVIKFSGLEEYDYDKKDYASIYNVSLSGSAIKGGTYTFTGEPQYRFMGDNFWNFTAMAPLGDFWEGSLPTTLEDVTIEGTFGIDGKYSTFSDRVNLSFKKDYTKEGIYEIDKTNETRMQPVGDVNTGYRVDGLLIGDMNTRLKSAVLCKSGSDTAYSKATLELSKYSAIMTYGGDPRIKDVIPEADWLGYFGWNLPQLQTSIEIKGKLEEGAYDLILETTDGRKARMKSVITATEKTIINYINYAKNYLLSASSLGDYISILVYGYHLNQNSAPVFYDADGAQLTETAPVASEVYKGYAFYKLKYTQSSNQFMYNNNYSMLGVEVPDGALSLNSGSTTSRLNGVCVGLREGTANNRVLRAEYNKNTKRVRVYFDPSYVREGEYVKFGNHYQNGENTFFGDIFKYPVWKDDGGLFAEMDAKSVTGSSILRFASTIACREDENFENMPGGEWNYVQLASYCIDIKESEINNPIRSLKNLTIPATAKRWTICPVSDMVPILENTTTGKNLLTKDQVSMLGKYGAVRVSVYNKDNEIVEHYGAFFGSAKDSSTYKKPIEARDVEHVENLGGRKYKLHQVAGTSLVIPEIKASKNDNNWKVVDGDKRIVKVSKSGTVKFMKAGTTTVKITSDDGDITLNVTVVQPKWIQKTYTVTVGDTIDMEFDPQGQNVHYELNQKSYYAYPDYSQSTAPGRLRVHGSKKGTVQVIAYVGQKKYVAKVKVVEPKRSSR